MVEVGKKISLFHSRLNMHAIKKEPTLSNYADNLAALCSLLQDWVFFSDCVKTLECN